MWDDDYALWAVDALVHVSALVEVTCPADDSVPQIVFSRVSGAIRLHEHDWIRPSPAYRHARADEPLARG